MTAQKVGIREFREQLAKFLLSANPVAITKHGETIGYYIPTRPPAKKSDFDALESAAAKMEALLASAGVSEDQIIEDFKQARRRKP